MRKGRSTILGQCGWLLASRTANRRLGGLTGRPGGSLGSGVRRRGREARGTISVCLSQLPTTVAINPSISIPLCPTVPPWVDWQDLDGRPHSSWGPPSVWVGVGCWGRGWSTGTKIGREGTWKRNTIIPHRLMAYWATEYQFMTAAKAPQIAVEEAAEAVVTNITVSFSQVLTFLFCLWIGVQSMFMPC